MGDLAEVSCDDVLLDLGCGDGQVVIAAAERSARCIGVDISLQRVEEARRRTVKLGLSHLCSFYCADFLASDYELPVEATVVYIFGSPPLYAKLQQDHRLNGTLRTA